jgi:hypothetical protein
MTYWLENPRALFATKVVAGFLFYGVMYFLVVRTVDAKFIEIIRGCCLFMLEIFVTIIL